MRLKYNTRQLEICQPHNLPLTHHNSLTNVSHSSNSILYIFSSPHILFIKKSILLFSLNETYCLLIKLCLRGSTSLDLTSSGFWTPINYIRPDVSHTEPFISYPVDWWNDSFHGHDSGYAAIEHVSRSTLAPDTTSKQQNLCLFPISGSIVLFIDHHFLYLF